MRERERERGRGRVRELCVWEGEREKYGERNGEKGRKKIEIQ